MIKNLLALAAFLVVVFAVVGWYMNWYRIETTTTNDGRRTIQIDLNNPKISQDLNEGKKKLQKILATEKDQQPANTPSPNTKQPNNNPQQEQKSNFWFDEDKTFVYPSAPEGGRENGFRREFGPPRPVSPTPPNTFPSLPPVPSAPPPGFPIQ